MQKFFLNFGVQKGMQNMVLNKASLEEGSPLGGVCQIHWIIVIQIEDLGLNLPVSGDFPSSNCLSNCPTQNSDSGIIHAAAVPRQLS